MYGFGMFVMFSYEHANAGFGQKLPLKIRPVKSKFSDKIISMTLPKPYNSEPNVDADNLAPPEDV